jgi:tetratricopeptide (TPR) repeat protein
LARSPALLLLAACLAPAQSGPDACAKCHPAAVRSSAHSLHTRLFQTAAGVPPIDGHRAAYRLGGHRFEQYLAAGPGGRLTILDRAWDVAARRWTSSADLHNPEAPPGEPWNRSCLYCHTSGPEKNFDTATLTYRTSWRSPGVDCEACHGPAADHLAHPSAINIVNPARLDPTRAAMICASCHTFRDLYSTAFSPGGNAYNVLLPVFEFRLPASDDPPFWPDGRPRWLANAYTGMLQSQCFLRGGATCVTCHQQGHSPEAAPVSCGKCHAAIAANPPAHTHHAEASPGSDCTACHMPPVVAGAGAPSHDHSMSVPVPELTARFSIPNACNLCHQDRDPAWASAQVEAWGMTHRAARSLRRAEAFTAARRGYPAAVPLLLAILDDSASGGWLRANAAGHLGAFPNDPAAYNAVLRSLTDPDPLVRAAAASALRPSPGQRPAAAAALVPLLSDPAAAIRAVAAVALVGMGVQPFPGEEGRRFEQAKELYRARAALFPDDPAQQFAAGQFFYLAGNADASIAAFRLVQKLDPAAPVRYPLARSLAKKGDLAGARALLQNLPASDPNSAAARQLLAAIEVHGAAKSAEALFREGEGLLKSEYYSAAIEKLDAALRQEPGAAWAHRARVYRAICLEKLSRTAEAEAALKALGAEPDPDLQLAYVELLADTGRAAEALARAESLAPTALTQFWRAKLLLQLHRTDDASAAARESLQLDPNLPQVHNLLIRLYQLQGRPQDAAREAQWLRDYERRVQSR